MKQQCCLALLIFLSSLNQPCYCNWDSSMATCSKSSSVKAIQLNFTVGDFVGVFAKTFVLSDGSTPVVSPSTSSGFLASGALKNVVGMLGDVGVRVGDNGTSLVVCEDDLLRIGMLAVLGNFVSTPMDQEVQVPGTIATVVVDVYTGALVVIPPYNVLREYFLETLLVISVLAIARLSLVRRVALSRGSVGMTAATAATTGAQQQVKVLWDGAGHELLQRHKML